MRAAAFLAVLLAVVGAPAAQAGPYADYSGRELYTRFCASCHGKAGFGDGPVAPSLQVLVPDLTRIYRRSGATFPEERVRRVVDGRHAMPAHGSRYMPVWGHEFRTEQGASAAADAEAKRLVDRLVEYLRSIQQ